MQTEKIKNLADAISTIVEVHTRDHPNGFAIERRADVHDNPSVHPVKYVQAWAVLRRAVGKQVAE